MAIKVYSPTDFEDTSSGVSIDGNLVVDTSVLYVDTANNKVGIGTTSPFNTLHIRSNGQQIAIDRADGQGALWRFYSWPSGLNIFPDSAKDIFIGRDGSTTNLQLHNGILRVLGTGDSYFTGNVGVGTTTPYSNVTLQYTGNNAAGTYFGNLVLNATTANTWNRLRFDRNGVARFGVALSYQDKFVISNLYTNGTTADPDDTAFVILQNSNVGIGTSSPTAKLDVNGEVRFRDGNIRGNSSFDFLTTGGAAQQARFKGIQVSTSYSGNPPSNGILFGTDTNLYRSAANTLRTSDSLVVDSNVLVGTTTDSGYKLNVNGTARFTDNVTISSSGAPKDLIIYGNTAGEFMQYDGSASVLNIYGKSNSPALGIFVNGGAQPTDHQIKIGRDVSQYYGIRVDDNTALLVHRQDESGSNTHQVFNDIWTSASGSHSWRWRIADAAGGNASQKMKLTKDSVLTLGGGSNTITNTKVGQWDTAYSWGNHASEGYLTSSSLSGYATESYVNTQVSNLVDSAPGTLDTLNELAAALGDDANFSTTVTNSIATKVPLSGNATITGMKTFATATSSQDDWQNSPISILERDNIGNGSTSNTYAPNLNFHWNQRVSNSLWMDYVGDLHWGSYSGTGVPATNGTFKTGTLYAGSGQITSTKVGQWDTAYSWGDHASEGYLTAHPNISAAASSNNSGRDFIQDIFVDGNGHILGIGTAQANTIIGTDSDINTSGATIIDNIYVTDGVITSMGTRTLTAADLGISQPNPPTITATNVVGETIEVVFNQSSTSDIDYYQVWSSVSGGSYGMIAQIPQSDIAATMTVIDAEFSVSGTMSYRVYAVKNGIYSNPAQASQAFTAPTLDVVNMSVVNLNTAYYIQYNMPDSRFVDHIEIYMDSEASSGSLSRTGATLVYSGNNTSYMHQISGAALNNYHQFWVEVIES